MSGWHGHRKRSRRSLWRRPPRRITRFAAALQVILDCSRPRVVARGAGLYRVWVEIAEPGRVSGEQVVALSKAMEQAWRWHVRVVPDGPQVMRVDLEG